MANPTSEELRALAEKAGLGARSTTKLLRALEEGREAGESHTPPRPRGHGAAFEMPLQLNEL